MLNIPHTIFYICFYNMICIIHHSLLSSNISLWHFTYYWSTIGKNTLYTSCYVKDGLPLTARQDPRDYCHIYYNSLLTCFNASFRFLNNSGTCYNRCIWWTYIIGSCSILLVDIRCWRSCWFADHIHYLCVCNVKQISTIPSVNSTIICLDIGGAQLLSVSMICWNIIGQVRW